MQMFTLVLKPRHYDDKGIPRWHDVYLVLSGLEAGSRGTPLGKLAVILAIAARMQLEREAAGLDKGGKSVDQEISINLSSKEARTFWRQLTKLKPEDFGGGQQVPPLGFLALMMKDIAAALEEDFLELGGDEQDEKPED
jgi:hypothetical protein